MSAITFRVRMQPSCAYSIMLLVADRQSAAAVDVVQPWRNSSQLRSTAHLDSCGRAARRAIVTQLSGEHS